MPSSISNSEQQVSPALRLTKAVAILLATIVIVLIAFEVITRLVIERQSKVQRMVNDEYTQAVHIRSGRPGTGPLQLLVVGNSLVGHGIDLDELKQEMEPRWQVHRYWIYNTSFTDWYFGLKRLFDEGSRPNVVAVVFAAMHWNANGTRGDYASQYLFETRDVPAIIRKLDLDKTETASLLLSRYSKFYAMRSEIRKVLLNGILPDLPRMYTLFKPGPSQQISDSELIPLATSRIEDYKRLAESHGASLVLIVPPVPRPHDEHQQALRTAAARAGVPIFMPLESTDVPAADFADDVHLTPEGAKLFTARLAAEMLPALNKESKH